MPSHKTSPYRRPSQPRAVITRQILECKARAISSYRWRALAITALVYICPDFATAGDAAQRHNSYREVGVAFQCWKHASCNLTFESSALETVFDVKSPIFGCGEIPGCYGACRDVSSGNDAEKAMLARLLNNTACKLVVFHSSNPHIFVDASSKMTVKDGRGRSLSSKAVLVQFTAYSLRGYAVRLSRR